MNREVRFRMITICFGLLTAAAVVLSQAFYFQAADFQKEKAKSEQTDTTGDSDQHEAFISIPDSSIPTSIHFELDHEFSFVLEILFNTGDQPDTFCAPALSAGQLFHTLFSVLISPNAP